MEQADLERIARLALKDLGVASALRVEPLRTPGEWRIHIEGGGHPAHLTIKCGDGSTPQWVRTQIFDQFLAQR